MEFRNIVRVLALVLFLCFAPQSPILAMDGGWEEVSKNLPEIGNVNYIYVAADTGEVYISAQNGLYVSSDNGRNWRTVLLPGTGGNAAMVTVAGSEMFLVSGGVLYSKQGDCLWGSFTKDKDLLGVVSAQEKDKNTVLAWSKDKLYKVAGDSLRNVAPRELSADIAGVIYKEGMVYLASGGEIFYSSDIGKNWGKYALSFDGNDTLGEVMEGNAEPQQNISGAAEESAADGKKIRYLDDSPYPFGVTVVTGKGLSVVTPEQNLVKEISTTGLPSDSIYLAVNSQKGLFAATANKVFVKNTGSDAWQPVFEGAADGKISGLKLGAGIKADERLWLATGKSVFCASLASILKNNVPAVKGNEIIRQYDPTINEVQAMAVRYAEVHPDKIKKWREGARWKAVMPKVSLNYSRSCDENNEIYTSATKSYVVMGPRDNDYGWGVNLSWDLSDIVWNESQTSIDVRSKLMVELRDNILEEVTRLYFERKRLMAEISRYGGEETSPLAEKKLRVDELTAYIDAYTGGEFSEAIASISHQ